MIGIGWITAALAAMAIVAAIRADFGEQIDFATRSVCIENGGDEELLCIAEGDGGERNMRRLDPGASLCATTPSAGTKGVVRVFEDEDSLEGCSRLAIAGQPRHLVRYAAFDNCLWLKP